MTVGHVWGTCVADGGMHGEACMCGRRDDHCSGQDTSYRSAFLFSIVSILLHYKINKCWFNKAKF